MFSMLPSYSVLHLGNKRAARHSLSIAVDMFEEIYAINRKYEERCKIV